MSSIHRHCHLTHPRKSLLRSVHHHDSSISVQFSGTTPPMPKLEVTSHQPIKSLQVVDLIQDVVIKPLKPDDNTSISTHVRCAIDTSQTVSEPTLIPEISIKQPKLSDPSLKSTWAHRAWFSCGCTMLVVSLAKCVIGMINSRAFLKPSLSALLGYLLADLGTGVVHWALDNYESGSNKLLSEEIDAFQGHHRCPLIITKRHIANNLHATARGITFTVLPINLMFNDPTIHAFVSVFAGCVMFSQQFHAWAHGTKSKLPRIVVALQDLGILVSRSQHRAHHHPPYNKGYCIVSSVWNDFLDQNKVFEAMEKMLFFRYGVRPRSWGEPIPLHVFG